MTTRSTSSECTAWAGSPACSSSVSWRPRASPAGRAACSSGNAELLFAQVIATVAVALYTVVVTTVLLLAIDRLIGLRVTAEEEDLGLDLTQHGQRGYMMSEGELIGIE